MNMNSPAPSIILLFVLSILLYADAARFTCNITARTSCQALAGYSPPNSTTFAAIMSLFQVKTLRQLLGANGLPLSTLASAGVPAGVAIRVPYPCSCFSGTAVSKGRPIYKVQPGDGIDLIARTKFGGLVTYREIAAANNISDPTKIIVGQELRVPLPCSCDPVDGQTVVHYAHVVAPGSSLDGIAAEFGTTAAAIMQINGIADPKSLIAGQVLDVPLRACSSSINQTSIDRNLRVPNGSYALTANNCVLCSCSSSTWQLDCHATQGISKSVCPVATCGSLNLGNTTSSSACEVTTCAYAGYTNRTTFTILTNLTTTTQPSCNDGNAPLSQPGDNSLSMEPRLPMPNWIDVLVFVHLGLILFHFLYHENVL